MSRHTGAFRFDAYELDFARSELRRAGALVTLQPTPLRVLLYLAEHRDRTVPRRELLDAIWPGVVVGDEALTTALAEARHAVGDDGAAQRVIRTLKGQGYRFAAEAEASLIPESRAQPEEALAADASAASTPAVPRRRRLAIVAGLLLLLGVGWGLWSAYRVDILARLALEAPRYFGNPLEQKVAYATTADGIRVAYATTGAGSPILVVIGWETHIEKGFMSPLYDGFGFLEDLSQHFRVVRYDGRGFGLSQRRVDDFSLDARVRDIEAVADALNLDTFGLYSASAGTNAAVAYTVRHPERVRGLILASGFQAAWSDPSVPSQRWDGVPGLYRSSWETPWVREMLVSRLDPELDEVGRRAVSELFRISADGPAMAGFLDALLHEDPTEMLKRVTVPTLVINGDRDNVVPLEWGLRLASLVPNSRFEILRGAGHTATSSGDPRMRSLVIDFLRETKVTSPDEAAL